MQKPKPNNVTDATRTPGQKTSSQAASEGHSRRTSPAKKGSSEMPDVPRLPKLRSSEGGKLYIKNMVCSRCKMMVRAEIEKAGLKPVSVELGEVELKTVPSEKKLQQIDSALRSLGFELIDNKKIQTIEKIKNAIVNLVHHADNNIKTNLSAHISSRIHLDYNYLSNLFSEVEGTTIEKYFISHKIEKVKELLVYNELTLSEIADRLGYSSVAYLSSQFKKITGLTPSYFRSLKENKRRNIEDL